MTGAHVVDHQLAVVVRVRVAVVENEVLVRGEAAMPIEGKEARVEHLEALGPVCHQT